MLPLLLACATHHAPLPAPTDDVLYFAMVDRFADGDLKNNRDVNVQDPLAWHGGDLDGLRQHLDHLQALGVRTLWLSPLSLGRATPFNGHGAFHGYWVRDLGALDPRFGTPRDLRRLRRDLSRRDMRLVLDIVWNHVDYDAPLREQRPEWFHDEGAIQDWADPHQRILGGVHGLPDLAQERPEVYAQLWDQTWRWLDLAQPDGLRVDAVGHLPMTFLARMNADLYASQGPDFWILGEQFDGDPRRLQAALSGADFSAVFDFPLHYAMIDTYCKDASPGRLGVVLSQDRVYGDRLRQAPGSLVTFLDNHDTSRVMSACHGQLTAVQQALLFQYSSRGTPSITWGTEAAQTGAGEPDNRADLNLAGPQPLAGTLTALAQLRREHPALTSGLTRITGLDAGALQLWRLHADEIAVVVVNRSDAPAAWGPLPPGRATGGMLAGPDGLSPWTGDGPVPAHSTAVRFILPDAPGGFQAQVDQQAQTPPRREVSLSVDRSGLADGDQLLWTGAHPSLGDWNPLAGVYLAQFDESAITVDVGTVLASKLVVLHPDGSTTWAEGPDSLVFVGPGEGPVRLTLPTPAVGAAGPN